MSEFLKFAYEVLSQVVYNLVTWIASFIKLFISVSSSTIKTRSMNSTFFSFNSLLLYHIKLIINIYKVLIYHSQKFSLKKLSFI